MTVSLFNSTFNLGSRGEGSSERGYLERSNTTSNAASEGFKEIVELRNKISYFFLGRRKQSRIW